VSGNNHFFLTPLLFASSVLTTGEMQEHFEHSVKPNNKDAGDPKGHRIALVLRDGDTVVKPNDSGNECIDLAPRRIYEYNFGRNLFGLEEGKLYTRTKLRDSGYHG
jgi:hypothetical protein